MMERPLPTPPQTQNRTRGALVVVVTLIAGLAVMLSSEGANAAATKACARGQTRNKAGRCVASAPVTTKRSVTPTTPATAAPGTAAPSTAAAAVPTTAAPAGASGQRDKITIAFPAEPDALDDYTGEHRFEGTQMNETLMIRDKKGAVVPWLMAADPKNIDPFQQDWELRLRTDVTFHDGSPFTAQSVVDQVNYARTVRGISELNGTLGAVDLVSATATSANVVKLSYSRPQPLLPTQLTYVKIQKIVGGRPVPVGTGPFRLVEWNRGRNLTMTAYDKYWGPKPNVKNIEMKYIPDPASRLAALLAGEVDIVTGMSVEDAGRAPQVIASAGSLLMYRIQLNYRDGPTADVRVRQALNYAIDKEGMIKAFFNGQAAIDNCQSLSPGMIGYNESLKPYEYDPAKAKALIKQSGAEGLKIELYQAADRWPKGTEIVTAVAQMWTAVGIPTTVRNVPFATWLEVAQKQPNPRPDSFFVGATLRLQDGADLRTYVLSNGTTGSVTDPVIDKLFLSAAAVADPKERDEAFQVLSAKYCRDATFAFLFSPKILTGAAKGINFTPDVRNERWTRVVDFTFAR